DEEPRTKNQKPSSSPNLKHRTRRLEKLVAVDPVTGLLRSNACPDQRGQLLIGSTATQQLSRVPLFNREETIANLPFGSQTQSVAIAAKRLRHWVDEADAAHAVRESVIDGRLARIGHRHRL